MMRVLLADDHPMIAAALDVLLRGSDYEMVGRARSGADALAQVQQLKPHLLLLDVNMPDGGGLDVLRQLRAMRRAPAVILLTAGMDDTQILTADKLGPEGMVLKTSDPALLLECMEAVRGGHCEPASVVRALSQAKLLGRPHVVDAVDSLLAEGRAIAENRLYRMVREYGLPDPV